ncbi:MAG: HD domain-containing protein [Chloroflexi bacterium]|nr:HD domain-containing protein [Chloroflexota bacterium]
MTEILPDSPSSLQHDPESWGKKYPDADPRQDLTLTRNYSHLGTLHEPPNVEQELQEKQMPSPLSRIGNFFNRIRASIKDWRDLQSRIKFCAASIAKNDRDVLEGIYNYRIVLSEVAFKPQKLDQDIWEDSRRIQQDFPILRRNTFKSPLFLRPRRKLREIDNAWEQLLTEQVNLINLLEKAPKSVDFYNRIHLARIKKHEEEVREEEISKQGAIAREAVEKTMARLGLSENTPEKVTSGSSILRLDDAKDYWTSRLQEIAQLETAKNLSPDDLINIYKGLENVIQDAPRMAEQVKEIEVMFFRLMSMHDELSAFGKVIIPSEELARVLITVQDEIPKLWATGSWEKLKRTLTEVSNFIKFYDLPIRSELSLAERRKPGMTRALNLSAGNLPLSQVTPLVRSLVSAIDARDRFMKGHSDAVARTVAKIGRRMGWSTEELEYLEIAALLHDVGKIVIPEALLTKLDPLSPDDWKTIQTHPYHGARIVKSIDSLNRVAPWVLHHQERWDGNGYPDRLNSESIPPASRIIAVGEAFTVMITQQPQRKALSLEEAAAEISRGSGTQFDPEAAAALVQSIESAEINLDAPNKPTG